MRRAILCAAFLGLAAATATAGAAAPALVFKVDKVTAAIVRNHLVVRADGAVKSGGWTAPRLHLKDVRVPEGDTETFEFQATPPASGAVVIDALLPITATAVFPLPRYATVQVKVMAQSNAVAAPVTPAPAAPAPQPKPGP